MAFLLTFAAELESIKQSIDAHTSPRVGFGSIHLNDVLPPELVDRSAIKPESAFRQKRGASDSIEAAANFAAASSSLSAAPEALACPQEEESGLTALPSAHLNSQIDPPMTED